MFKWLTVYMSVVIIISTTLLMGTRYLLSGFSFEETFKHMSFLVFLIILVCTPIFSAGFSFLIAQWLRVATITISNEEICGRNFWGAHNKIPLNEISKLTRFSSNGIDATVVNSHYHGQI